MKKILAILLSVAMLMSMAVAVSAEGTTATGSFTATYDATFTESDWNSEPTIDESTLVNATIGGRSTLVNIWPAVLEVANADKIVSVKLNVTSSVLDTWQRAEDHPNSGTTAGSDVTPGAGYLVNSDWTNTETDWYMPDGTEFVVTEEATGVAFNQVTKLQVAVFGGSPAEKATITVNVEVTYEVPEEPKEPEVVDPWKQVETSLNVSNLNGVSGDLQLVPIKTLSVGDKVVVHFTGTTVGPFRYWISNGAWTAASAQTTVSNTEFDIVTELEITVDGANSVQFKGPSGGSLDNLTISYCGIFYGTKAEYDEAVAAVKPVVPTVSEGTSSGYLCTGEETHLILINGAAITTPHDYVDGACKFCGYVAPVTEEEIIVEVVDPTEPATEEEEDTTVEADTEVEENPETGLALAVIPAIVALAAVALSKR